jgi:predicted kinase
VNPGKLTVIVGLPGSGKSTLVEEKKRFVTGLCVHDYHAAAHNDSPRVEDSRYYHGLIESLRAGHDCVIADIAFCDARRTVRLCEAFTGEVAGLRLEWIYFENAPDKCRSNIQRRARESVSSDLKALDEFAQLYRIPEGVAPRAIVGSVFWKSREK